MNPQDDDTNTRTGLWVVFTTVAVLLISVIIWILKGSGMDTDTQSPQIPASVAASLSGTPTHTADHQGHTGTEADSTSSMPAHGAVTNAANTAAAEPPPASPAIEEETQFIAFDNIEEGELAAVVHFASASATLPSDAGAEIAGVIDALKASSSRRVLLAGFHDPTGNAAFNADLARKRAFSIRNALLAQGIPTERIILRKPEQTAGSGTHAEARRVELRLLD